MYTALDVNVSLSSPLVYLSRFFFLNLSSNTHQLNDCSWQPRAEAPH